MVFRKVLLLSPLRRDSISPFTMAIFLVILVYSLGNCLRYAYRSSRATLLLWSSDCSSKVRSYLLSCSCYLLNLSVSCKTQLLMKLYIPLSYMLNSSFILKRRFSHYDLDIWKLTLETFSLVWSSCFWCGWLVIMLKYLLSYSE